MKLLTNEQRKLYGNAKICCIFTSKFEDKLAKDRKYCKVRDHFHYTREYRGAVHGICNLKYSVPKEIPIFFLNGSNFDDSFIMKELAEEFQKQFLDLGQSTEKYITFSVLIEKEVVRIHKSGEEIIKTISYR